MLNSIEEVVASQLCTGCGACAYLESGRYRMADTLEYGRRPFLVPGSGTKSTQEAIRACPGLKLKHTLIEDEDAIAELRDGWGQVLGVWEGYAADDKIRFSGSSGGVATALALFCLEQRGMSGVVHTAARKDVPYLNETAVSRNREELTARAGSRYSPASPAEKLSWVEQSDKPCVFIGKPCDAAAAQEAKKLRPQLERNLGITIAFFCAGTPSVKGTLDLLAKSGVADPADVKSLRYRGQGWPGMWAVQAEGADGQLTTHQMTYAESWGFLQRYRQWRCYICPDHTGEFADIAVGDPWYRKVEEGEPGKSLIVARTAKGLEMIKAAAKAGVLVLERSDPSLLPKSQPNLLETRGALWARLLVLRAMGAAVPQYQGFALFKFWKNLRLAAKVSSFTGTIKRVITKKLNRRIAVTEWSPD